MNGFTKRRERARVQRDKLIAYANAECEETLVQIATLEQDLLGKLSLRHQKTNACIESVRSKHRWHDVPDGIILRSVMNRRKG